METPIETLTYATSPTQPDSRIKLFACPRPLTYPELMAAARPPGGGASGSRPSRPHNAVAPISAVGAPLKTPTGRILEAEPGPMRSASRRAYVPPAQAGEPLVLVPQDPIHRLAGHPSVPPRSRISPLQRRQLARPASTSRTAYVTYTVDPKNPDNSGS